jgi:hypothetical protein
MSDKIPYRIRITDTLNNISYIVRDEKGRVDYYSSKETPLALANVFGDAAAELRFKLKDAKFGADASKEVRALTKYKVDLL